MTRACSATESLRAEIRFRRFHRAVYPQILEYMELAYRERRPVFGELEKRGFRLSPFVEIGAETGPNALTLVNGLGADGAACDISPDSLAAMPAYAMQLGADKLPMRIVCDAANLPFRDHSLPFVLAWGTLHHFPEPEKAIREIQRVLGPGGIFYFDGEPVKRRLSADLWTTKSLYHMGPVQKALLQAGLLPWLASIDGAEAMAEGVTERKPTMKEWETLMTAFDRVEWRYSPYITGTIPSAGRNTRRIANRLFRPENLDRTIVGLFGGAVGGICRMTAGEFSVSPPATNIEQALACPNCEGKPRLKETEQDSFLCSLCNRTYEIRKGILSLLDDKTSEFLREFLLT